MTDFAFENPDKVTEAEILVGIPSRNEAESIGFVTEQASLGLTRYFSGRSVAIVNCDNNSKDGTKESFFNAPASVPRVYVSTPEGVSGKGNNIKNLFRVAGELKSKAIVVLDADTRSVTPKWIKNLAEPLFSEYAFVSPLYISHKYASALTNHIVYPMSRCLYGRRVRQPIGGEFGFTGELARFFLGHESWTDSVAHFGVDIYMTTLAMYFGKPISQAFLGSPKIHRPMNPRNALGPGFREVVGTLFHLQTHLVGFWRDVKHSRPTAIFGFGVGETEPPEQVEIDKGALYSALREGYGRHKEVWKEVLAGETFSKLEEVLSMEEQHFELPVNLWAHILFDMSVAYRDKIVSPDRLTDSLVPLYQGRILSFAKNTEGMMTGQAEEYVEEECLDFEEAKPYLLKRWG